jgi:serine protease Do
LRSVIALWAVLAGLAMSGAAVAATAPEQGPPSVAALASRLAASVVNISSSHRLEADSDKGDARQNPDGSNSGDPQRSDPMAEAESLGSGFVVSADGLVVTNDHVIEGGDSVLVYLTDGTRLPARIIGEDSKTDLAVLKIDAGHPLPFVQFGDSDSAAVGDWVMAIGNPFGLGGTVTLGIVSARNRDIQEGPYDSFIQTDASINEGNSGGPLFDMDGKVVGINTAIIAQGEASLGIGFAIPANLASPVIDQLITYGAARRGWIGVDVEDMNEDIAQSLGLSNPYGAIVTQVTKDGPAEGLLDDGDIITSFDGQPIRKMHDLPRLVAETSIGKSVPVKIERAGADATVNLVVGELKGEAKPLVAAPAAAAPPAPIGKQATFEGLLGFAIAPIDPTKRRIYALPNNLDGLVVTSVKAGSDAYAKGIIAGMVVSALNEQKVATLSDALDVARAAVKAGRPALLLGIADPTGGSRYIAVRFVGQPVEP